jgi:hypothetical protein
MKRRKATILMIVVGVLAFCAIVTVSLGAWFFASVFESTRADEQAATDTFDDIRQRFSGVSPVFSIVDDEEAVLRRSPPDVVRAAPLRTLEIRHWDPDDEDITSVSLPFWVLRLKTGTFSIGGRHPGHLNIKSNEIERYGPTLLVDHEGRGGDRLLVWTE